VRRQKVGYLSAFFGAANWMKAVFPVINRHDRTRFEVHMISDGENPSEASGYRDWPDDYVHDIRGLDNDRAAAVLRDVGLDVLVDLNGYSFQARTPLLLRRPAPVILGWFNYFATSGIAPVDALIGDETVIDPAAAGHYSERCIALPGCYLGFEVDYPVPEVTAPPSAAGAGGLTFGCLGSQYKLDDALVAAWARILAAAPASRLFLKNATLEDASSRGHLRARLEQAGIAQDRVELSGRDDHFDFLAAYGQIDIALDTFPYNGGTTTCEALWQGVPVLAIAGDRWVNRVSASILKASDLGDWVTPDVDAFVRRAADLANDPETPGRLAALRSGMRDRLRRAPICDGEALTRSLEAIYVSEAERAAQSVL
jgi:predicted O-linked N-acetylglucosamine transferase (SPINDLY family)